MAMSAKNPSLHEKLQKARRDIADKMAYLALYYAIAGQIEKAETLRQTAKQISCQLSF
jgi:hypothetical protein